MRGDMHKLIIECGRGGFRNPAHKRSWSTQGLDIERLDELPKRSKMRPLQGIHRTYIGDRLAPLQRFIKTMEGRTFGDLRREIAEIKDPLHRYHVWTHVESWLLMETRTGEVASFGFGPTRWHNNKHTMMYSDELIVCQDGVIRKFRDMPVWSGLLGEKEERGGDDIPRVVRVGGRLLGFFTEHGTTFAAPVVDVEVRLRRLGNTHLREMYFKLPYDGVADRWSRPTLGQASDQYRVSIVGANQSGWYELDSGNGGFTVRGSPYRASTILEHAYKLSRDTWVGLPHFTKTKMIPATAGAWPATEEQLATYRSAVDERQ